MVFNSLSRSCQAPLSNESLQESKQNNVLCLSWFLNANPHRAYCHVLCSSFAKVKCTVYVFFYIWYSGMFEGLATVALSRHIWTFPRKEYLSALTIGKIENCKPRQISSKLQSSGTHKQTFSLLWLFGSLRWILLPICILFCWRWISALCSGTGSTNHLSSVVFKEKNTRPALLNIIYSHFTEFFIHIRKVLTFFFFNDRRMEMSK